MKNTQDSMNSQYGEKEVKIDVPKFILYLIKNFWISREDYSRELIKKYKLIWKENLLDIGCGDGDFCQKNKQNFWNIYWIDISDKRILRAQEIYRDIDFSVWDMNGMLSFEDSYFDCINSLVVFDWIYDLNNALSETYRILKKDWIFILQVNNMWFLLRRLQLLFWSYPKISAFSRSEWKDIGWDASVCHMFTKKELQNYLEQFWFQVLEVRWSWFLYKLRNWWPSLLCWDLFFVCRK